MLSAANIAVANPPAPVADPPEPLVEPLVWLTHSEDTIDRVRLHWLAPAADTAGKSDQPPLATQLQVQFGNDRSWRTVAEASRLSAHVDVDRGTTQRPTHYRWSTDTQVGDAHVIAPIPERDLRIIVAANWQGFRSSDGWLDWEPHLVVSAGDLVGSIIPVGAKPDPTGLQRSPPKSVIDWLMTHRAVLGRVPFMAVSGNHDRQVRPRKDRSEDPPVYDISGTAFRRTFAMPDGGLWWSLDAPDFRLRLIGLDLHHTSDFGTAWQSGSDFDRDSPMAVFDRRKRIHAPEHVVTIYNEQHSAVARLADGFWRNQIASTDGVAISGFGHFAELARDRGITLVNTSLQGRGDVYANPNSQWIGRENNHVRISIDREGPMRVAICGTDGRVLKNVNVTPKDRATE